MLTETCYFRYHHFNFQQLDLQLNFQLCSWRTLRSRTTSGSRTGSWGRGSSGSWRSWRRPLTTPRVMVGLPPTSCQGEQPQIKITWQWRNLSWFFWQGWTRVPWVHLLADPRRTEPRLDAAFECSWPWGYAQGNKFINLFDLTVISKKKYEIQDKVNYAVSEM